MDLERGRGSHDDVAQPLRHLELLRRQRTAAGHDLRLSLRVERLTLGICEAYGIERLARARRVLVARAEGVHQLVRDDDVVAAGQVLHRESVDVTLGARRAVAIERVEAYPERFLPALRRDAVEPGVDRDAGEHQQQEENADVLPHARAVSSSRQCPRGQRTGSKAAGAWPTRVPA